MTQPKSWQELLDFLTLKAKQDGILNEVEKFGGEDDIIKVCYREEFYRNKLLEWITSTINITSFEKSSSKSSSFRLLGNEKFCSKDNHGSLLMYTESVRYAPDNSEDLALALANRSAVLFHMQCFEDCLRDIELAFQKAYPPSLHYKLYTRQGQCLLKLGRHKEACIALESAQKSLKEMKDAPVGKKVVTKFGVQKILDQALSQLQIKENADTISKNKLPFQLPLPTHGENQKFAYASEALDLKYEDMKGRHVVTNRDIRLGDILFVEKPYAFVVLPDQYRKHCHHCCKAYIASVPCLECTEGLYCSEPCRKESWEQYHQWECHGGLELLHSIGIAHLGLRVVLKAGTLEKIRSYLKPVPSQVQIYGNKGDNYPAVHQLMPHLEDMQPEDRLHYGLTAALLTLYLSHHSDYFKQNTKCTEPVAAPNSSDVSEEVVLVGGLILRHIAQLVCNGHAITKLDTTSPNPLHHGVVTESQVRIATAIYPSASMMNHSCDPSIINSFSDQYLIVRACKDISKGEEVYNCYGPHFRRMSLLERQEALKSQYFFTCNCDNCSHPLQYDFQKRFSALLCSSCGGPLMETKNRKISCIKDKTYTHHMVCSDCSHSQDYSNMVETAFVALNAFNEGCTLLEIGNVKDAIQKFQTCQRLQQQCLYRNNRDTTACTDQIAKCYAMLGEYNESVLYLSQCLPAVEEQFGSHSIELANELQKLSDVMICDLKQEIPGSSCFKEKCHKAVVCVDKAKQILDLHYGIWNSGLQEILQKEQWLKKKLNE